MKKQTQKLTLSKETVRHMTEGDLGEVAGGGYSKSCISCNVSLGFCQNEPNTSYDGC